MSYGNLILAGCAEGGAADSGQACLYRTKDKQHHTKWASCRVPPLEVNSALMGAVSAVLLWGMMHD